ncbi:hypothetical protein XF35_11725 [Streptomyces platensis subsp. clarensis]|nr:hypothetical protein [Streptomyces platensis subsp. clarensis]
MRASWPRRISGSAEALDGGVQPGDGCLDASKHADQGISAKYYLRYLRRDLRDNGATPPDLPPALADVDPHEVDTNTTPEERL